MPRVHHTKANKDYPNIGVKKGEMYYSWAFYRGPTQRSKTPPRQSQITGSANLSEAYAVGEGLEDALAECKSVSDVVEAIGDAVAAAEDVISGYEETVSNLEQAFQGGCPALEEAQSQLEALESYKNELEAAVTECEQIDPTEHDGVEDKEFDEQTEEVQAAMLDAAREIAQSLSFDI